jgi:hypothetical protein
MFVGFVLECIGLAALLFWLQAGAHMVTQYQVAEVQQVEDEFGDDMEQTVMVDRFQFGLLPDRGYDAALPWMIVGLGGGFACVFLGIRRRRLALGNELRAREVAPEVLP